MNVRISSVLTASAFFGALVLLPQVASAKELDKCGGVFLTASSQCSFQPVQQCKTSCATTSVEQVCAAKTYTSCAPSCTVTDVTTCTQTLTDSCAKECTTITTKSSHDVCVSECSTNCTSDAEGKGKFGGDQNKCGESCSHDCNAQCDSLSTTDQTTDCMTKCTSIIADECKEQVNRDCVLDCQTTNYDACETTTVNTCTTSCTDKGGAIFCDGQFLDADNLQDCASQLSAEFSFNIDVSAAVSGTVTTTNTDGSKTTAKCSYSDTPVKTNGILFGALGAVGIAVIRRRRQKK